MMKYAAYVRGFGLTLDEVTYGHDAVKYEEFDCAYQLLVKTMEPFGKNGSDDAAYFIVDENYGTRELLVEKIAIGIDWAGAKAAIARAFGEQLPRWSIIVRTPAVPDERIGRIDG